MSEAPSNSASDRASDRAGRATTRPLASVVIPCYNHAALVGAAIESALAQTSVEVEVLLVDDGSTDDTPAVARRYPSIHYVRQENRGLCAARNAGLRASRGEYVAFLDADDVLLPGAVDAGIRHLELQPAAAFAAGRFYYRRLDGRREAYGHPVVRADHYRELLRRNFIPLPASVVYRRGTLERAGGFDARHGACGDYELYLRLARLHPVTCHDEFVAEYRLYETTMSSNLRVMFTDAMRVLHRQRPHVRRDPVLRAAYEEGIALYRDFYGGPMVKAAWADVRRGVRVGPSARALLAFLRYDPAGAARRVGWRVAGRGIPSRG